MVLVGVTDLGGAFLPRSAGEALEIDRRVSLHLSLASRAALMLVGVGAALVLRGVWRGRRRAWLLSTALAGISAVLHLVRDRELASVAICVAVGAALLIDRASYRVPGRALEARWLALPLLGIAVVAYGVAGWIEHGDGLPDLSVAGRSEVILRGLAFLPPGVRASTPTARAFLDALPVAGALMLMVLASVLLLPARTAVTPVGDRRQLAAFLGTHGRTSSAPLAGVAGNDVLALERSGAVVGLRVIGGVAVTVGPPVGPSDPAVVLAEFVDLCERHGWTPAVVDADAATARTGEALGFAALKIGEEAFLDLDSFSLQGKARANVRHSTTRAERDGVVVARYGPEDRTATDDAQLTAISDAWLATKHGPELGFTLGRFDPEAVTLASTYVARREDQAVAFVTWLPYSAGEAAVLDLMRRAEDCPPGTMELLVTRSLEDLRQRGYRSASLGGVPLASTTDRAGPIERALGWVYEHGGTIYEAKGLFAFKRKFDPRWEPIFLLFPSGGDLPRIATAVGRAFVPTGLKDWRQWLPRRPGPKS